MIWNEEGRRERREGGREERERREKMMRSYKLDSEYGNGKVMFCTVQCLSVWFASVSPALRTVPGMAGAQEI